MKNVGTDWAGIVASPAVRPAVGSFRSRRRGGFPAAGFVICLLGLAVAAAGAQQPVRITIDRSAPLTVSRLELGITHTQNDLDSGAANRETVSQVKEMCAAACRFQVEPIMGWGADNPEPSPGIYNWETLDRRMALIRSMRAIPVMTFCAAPDWMKGGEAGKTDWSKIEVAPVPAHFADFAALAKEVARRYPDVRYFQVWNEFKGFWDTKGNNWNAARYTEMYNLVYSALKSVSPAIKVGGPYLVLEGTGTDPAQWWGAEPISPRNRQVLDYWLKHKRGADFIVLDRSVLDTIHDPNRYTEQQAMPLTRYFGDIVRQVRAMTDLPIWWAEVYGGGSSDLDFTAAQFASIYRHMAVTGADQHAFLWGPLAEEGSGYQLFTRLDRPDGGRPTPHYRVFRAFHDDFRPGTQLVKAASSSPDIEVLASARNTLLINKRAQPVVVALDGTRLTLSRYEVRVLNVGPKR